MLFRVGLVYSGKQQLPLSELELQFRIAAHAWVLVGCVLSASTAAALDCFQHHILHKQRDEHPGGEESNGEPHICAALASGAERTVGAVAARGVAKMRARQRALD